MKIFIKHSLVKHNILRAIRVSIIVGTILGLVNHFDMFLSGNYDPLRVVQILVTYLVPFFVSLFSSAMSGRHFEMNLEL